MKVRKMIKMAALALATFVLAACGQIGPSDELVSMELIELFDKTAGGYINFDVTVLDREEVSKDVVKVKIKINGYRNEQELQFGDVSAMAMGGPIAEALRLEYGFPFPEKVTWVKYVKNGEKWELRGRS